MEKLPVEPASFAVVRAYATLWLEELYRREHVDLFRANILSERALRAAVDARRRVPAIVLFGGFVAARAGILSLCQTLEIDTVHSEDGFFPHYTTLHVDPVGFCWESSLTRLQFRKCSEHQRQMARAARTAWLDCRLQELPPSIRHPFVLWPLQLVGDSVNRWDLNVSDWTELIRDFRRRLPPSLQLVVKLHPRSAAVDIQGIAQLVGELPNTTVVPASTDLRSLLRECRAVAGVNSTVLYEGRLMFHKPTYVCGKGWFTNHIDLFLPVEVGDTAELPRLDWLERPHLAQDAYLSDYADWFLYQLLIRQIGRTEAERSPGRLEQHVRGFSRRAFACYGEELFA
jgi:capsule polysaccharide modification protein KpsS